MTKLALAAAAAVVAATFVDDTVARSALSHEQLVTGLAWSSGVPNALVRGGVAFNLADLAIAVGDALLIGGALWHAARNRDRLRERV